MQKIKIRLPATVTHLMPGLHSLGLALQLYTTVEFSGRNDEQLRLEINGEGRAAFATPLLHPIVLAMGRFFQQLEKTQLGIHIKIDNAIPLKSGLGAEDAFRVAGVLGANHLMGNPCDRDTLLKIAAAAEWPVGVVAALLGGLATAARENSRLIYRALPVTPFPLIVVLPQLEQYAPAAPPEQIDRSDVPYDLSRVPLLIEALRQGDLELLAYAIDDKLQVSHVAAQITGYQYVADTARQSGALAVTIASDGPALLAFAEKQQQTIANNMKQAFQKVGVAARSWVLPIDTQGVVISEVRSV